MTTAVDLFAGPGGWDVAARDLGIHTIGIELNSLACATRRAAGLATVEGSVTDYGPAKFPGASGLIASPPCPTFSIGGRGKGRAQMVKIVLAVEQIAHRQPVTIEFSDDITPLVLEPFRWALEALDFGTPYRWLAFEQVKEVLPVWDLFAAVLQAEGYSTDTGILHAEQYSVPQVRKRAVLVTSLDREAQLPRPTHSRYYSHTPARLDSGVLPWVPMADAVGWGFTHRPSQTLVSQSDGGRRLLDGGSGAWDGVLRAVEAGQWIRRPDRLDRPFNRGEVSTTPMRDGAILQTFPADYPWQGVETMQAKQIGNAVPPMLARAVLSAVAA